jgi:flagellar protein FliO/FliZ
MNRLLALLYSTISVSAIAADAVPTRASAADLPGYGGSMLPTLGALALVITAILITGFLMRRFTPSLRGGGSLIKPVSHLQIGPKEKIAVIQFQDELLVLGVTASNITLLTKSQAAPGVSAAPPAFSQNALVAKWASKLRPSGQGESATTGESR